MRVRLVDREGAVVEEVSIALRSATDLLPDAIVRNGRTFHNTGTLEDGADDARLPVYREFVTLTIE